MGKVVGIVKSGYYLGKLVLGVFWLYPYLRWRIWRAKHAFRRQLEREGLEDKLVRNLVEDYNRHNKRVIGLVTNGFDAITDFDINLKLKRRA